MVRPHTIEVGMVCKCIGYVHSGWETAAGGRQGCTGVEEVWDMHWEGVAQHMTGRGRGGYGCSARPIF